LSVRQIEGKGEEKGGNRCDEYHEGKKGGRKKGRIDIHRRRRKETVYFFLWGTGERKSQLSFSPPLLEGKGKGRPTISQFRGGGNALPWFLHIDDCKWKKGKRENPRRSTKQKKEEGGKRAAFPFPTINQGIEGERKKKGIFSCFIRRGG